MTKMIKVDTFADGAPRKFTDVGGYPIFYVTGNGDCLCPRCALEAERIGDDPAIACDANWEDPSLYCDDCGARIESAYAEDQVEADEIEA